MKLELLVITLVFSLTYGDENSTTATSAATTPTTTSSSVASSSSTIQVSTSTQSPPSTSIAPKVENSTKPAKLPSNRSQLLNTTHYACTCDLTLNCDVNCCCDMDCSDGILQAFECDDGVKIDDYFHGEGLEMCEVKSGLLCIVNGDSGAVDYDLKIPHHPEYSTYRWPKLLSTPVQKHLEPRRDFYKYGDPIMTYDTKAEKLDTINIPASLTDSTCYFEEPLKFLDAKTSKCLQSVNSICSYNNNLMRQLFNSQLFRRPSKMTETREASDVLSINIQSCKHSFINCTQMTLNEEVNVEALELMGDELFDEIRMEFHINDTNISSLLVTFLIHDDDLFCGIDELGPMKVLQTVDVRFINVNDHRERKIRKISRGFDDGDLIVASRYRPVNESNTEGDWAFDYFNNESISHDFHMKIPDSRRGRCVLNDDVFDEIQFNENSLTFCYIELVRDEKLNETSCQQFQRQIIHFLFSTMNLTVNYTQTQDNFASDVFVSKLWSPRYEINSWTRVNVRNVPPPESHTENVVNCLMSTSISYSFYSTRVRNTVGTKKYENFIHEVSVDFGNAEEIKIAIDDENQNRTMKEIQIQVQVQFLNALEKNNGKLFIFDVQLIIASCLVTVWFAFA